MNICHHTRTELADHARGSGRTTKDERCVVCNMLRSTLVKHMEAMPHDFNPDEMDRQSMAELEDWHQHDHMRSDRGNGWEIDHPVEDYGDKVRYVPVKDLIADLQAMLRE